MEATEKLKKAQRGMNMEPGMNPTPNDMRTSNFINAMDNVDRGLNRILPGRPGRQRNRAIKRATRQDARLDKAINRINNRGNSPMETLPAANTRIPQPIYPGMSEMDRMSTRPMTELMGGGSVTNAKAYRNNTRGKARKNR